MSDPYFFGYGSLVNVESHVYRPVTRAVLPAWRRRWRATHIRPAAFLTGEPDPGSDGIDGLMAPVPNGDWAALDLREGGYARVDAPGLRHDIEGDVVAAVYAIPEDTAGTECVCPILLSYLDVVIKGYRDQFGEAGVARFVQTTEGWDMPIACDRDAPLYPRAQSIDGHVRGLVDYWLDQVGAPRLAVSETALGRTG